VKVGEVAEGAPATTDMPFKHRGLAPLAAIIAAVVTLSTGAAAWADQTTPLSGAGLVAIKSPQANVTVLVGNPGEVRIVGDDSVTVTHFAVSANADGHIVLPGLTQPQAGGANANAAANANVVRGRPGLGQRSFDIPGLQDGSDGINIVNPGTTEVTVYVPPQVAALFVGGGRGDVSVSDTHGGYVIVTGRGAINLQNVAGRGLVRSGMGPITLNGIGGAIGVETLHGLVTAREMAVGRADVFTQTGNVDWQFSSLGRGGYRFNSRRGDIRVGLAPDAAANVDAQSETGDVFNTFGRPDSDIHFLNRHALSMALNGGGPEINVSSGFGRVTISPHRPLR
jgi:hypothetical protein